MDLLVDRKYFLVVGVLFISLIVDVTIPNMVQSDVVENQYYLAEKLYCKLTKHTNQQVYRGKWLLCIDEFNIVYKSNQNGPWAAAGLYKTGLLYIELYKRFFLESDILEAVDILKRVIKRFPESLYSSKAKLHLEQLSQRQKDIELGKANLNDKLAVAKAAFEELIEDREQQGYRSAWINVMDQYKDIYITSPNGELAVEALFMLGSLHMKLYHKFLTSKDKVKCNIIFTQLQTLFPESPFAKKAIKLVSDDQNQLSGISNCSLESDEPKLPTDYVTVKNLRVWSNPTYTRVVVDLDKETFFSHSIFKKNSSSKGDYCLCVDLSKSKLDKNIMEFAQINNELLKSARASQNTPDTVRVFVDMKSFCSYKIFTLKNPYRIVIDILGKNENDIKDAIFLKEPPQDTIARQLSLGVGKIVIDPGHGGKDYGASGILQGIYEKDITLQIANCLAKKVKTEIGCEVVLTRETDCYLSLEERTAIANTESADLFISIHTNAAENKKAFGMETFFLNLATDNDSILVAARENATSTKNISDLESILNDLMNNARINESSRLAYNVQNSLCMNTADKYTHILNKGVKQAPFYVLLGAQMPAILVETSFISNIRECERLKNSKYQEVLCDGIVRGIEEYIMLNKTDTNF